MVTYNTEKVSIDKLLLDPNNYRFRKPGQDRLVSEERSSEAGVQSRVLDRIRSDGVGELKDSIAENGFIPVERIVVRPYEGSDSDGRYLVIEGNRRTAALKLLQEDHTGGADFDENVIEVFQSVPVLVATDVQEEDILAIMGVRHVGGPKEWGGYQSALLIFELFQEDLSPKEVAHRLGLSTQEVNRRYRAFGALSQMMQDDDFADAVTTDMYPIFHEAVGTPIIRDWLEWSDDDSQFKHENNRPLFYSWLSSEEGLPKIRSYSEVRNLKSIIENEDALVALKDDNQTFPEALAIVHSEAKSKRWLPNAKSALKSLKEIGPDTVDALSDDELVLLKDLKRLTSRIIRVNAMAYEDDDADD